MFLGLTLVDCVARAGAVEELIHIFLMNEKWSHFVILTVALIAAAVAWSGHVVLHSAAKVWRQGRPCEWPQCLCQDEVILLIADASHFNGGGMTSASSAHYPESWRLRLRRPATLWGRDDLRVVRTLPPIVESPLADASHFNGGGMTSASSAHHPESWRLRLRRPCALMGRDDLRVVRPSSSPNRGVSACGGLHFNGGGPAL